MQKCWEFKKSCSKESCPVFNKHKHQIIAPHCWAIDGALCDGKVVGSFTDKIEHCRQCSYFAYLTFKIKKPILVGV